MIDVEPTNRGGMLSPEALEELRDLARALVLGHGFSFHLLVSPSPRATAAAVRLLEHDEGLLRHGLSLHRHRTQLGLPPGEALADSLRGMQPGAVVFLDLSRVVREEESTLTPLFEQLNATRNSLAQLLVRPLLLCVPEFAEGPFARAAPDLWSVRSTVTRLTEVSPSLSTLPPLQWRPSWLLVPASRVGGHSAEVDAAAWLNATDEAEARWKRALVLLENGARTDALTETSEAVALLRARTSAGQRPGARRAFARALEAAAVVLRETGDLNAAIERMQESLTVRERVRAENPDHWDRTLTLAESLFLAANILGDAGRAAEAEAHARRALELLSSSEAPEARPLLATAHEILGTVHFQTGQFPLALLSLQTGLEIRAAYFRTHPSLIAAASDLARALRQIGVLETKLGLFAPAREHVTEAMSLLRRATGGTASRELAELLSLLGRIEEDRGDIDRAAAASKESAEIFNALAHRPGASVEAVKKAAQARGQLGQIEFHRGQVDAGRRELEASLAMLREIARVAGPAVVRSDLMSVLSELSGALAREHPGEAIRLLDEAIAVGRDARSSGEVPYQVADALSRRAGLMAETGRFKEANQDVEEELQISLRLAHALPTPFTWHRVALSHARAATIAVLAGQPELARSRMEQARTVLSRVVAEAPPGPSPWARDLAEIEAYLRLL